MKFFIVVAYCVLFFVALARADDDDGEDAAGHSASQFNGNNIGDISNVQIMFEGELHSEINQDIISIIIGLLNEQTIVEGGADDDDDDEEEDKFKLVKAAIAKVKEARAAKSAHRA